MDSLRLVLIAPFARYPKGTTRARVLPLARALAELGHQVTVLVPPYDHPVESGRRYHFGAARVECLSVDARVPEESLRQAFQQPRLAAAAVRRTLALEPDVAHVFKPKAVSGLTQMGLWYVRGWRRLGQLGQLGRPGRPGRPALVLDTDDWEGFGGWNEREAYPWWQKQLCDTQERWGLRHADAVTVASRTLQAQAWSHRVPLDRAVYLPNGLAADDYPGWRDADAGAARASLRLGTGPLLLLYTRFFEFEPERVFDVLLRVRREVADARLLVVGAGKFGQEQRLPLLARRHGVDDAVVNAGWQPPAALPALLSAADVALFPMDDNLANRAKCSAKLLEALWLGVPVVADRVGQQVEYIHHGATGLLSDPGDSASMAGAAIRLLRDRPLAQRLAEAGRRWVETEFNWPRLARAAERAYAVALAPLIA